MCGPCNGRDVRCPSAPSSWRRRLGGTENEEKKIEEPPQGVPPPPQGVPPPPQGVELPPQEELPPPQHEEQNLVPQPPPQVEDKFEKLFGAPLSKDANSILPGRKAGPARNPLDDRLSSVESGDGEVAAHFKATLRRAEEKRIFNEVTLLFDRQKDRPAHDSASSVKTALPTTARRP